jgi:enterochelin esterase-like enzyme
VRRVVAAIIILLAGLSSAGAQPATSNIQRLELKSKTFNNTRTLRVLLPPGYDERENTATRYPVLYLNDAFEVFHYWNAEAIVRDAIRSSAIEPLIVVGIDHAGETEGPNDDLEARTNEYLPYADVKFEPAHPRPQGNLYPQFLVDEVMPYINQRFRTRTGPANTALGGASYGATISLYTVIKRPGIFGKLLLESTNFALADFQLVKDVRSAQELPALITLGVGTNEAPNDEINQRIVEGTRALDLALRETSRQTRTRLSIGQGASHNSDAWKSRLPAALVFLFGVSGGAQ